MPLLEPKGRRVRLTRAAVSLVGHTEIIMRELECAATTIAVTRAGVGGQVRIATFQTAAHTVLLDTITLSRRLGSEGNVTLDAVTDALREAIKHDGRGSLKLPTDPVPRSTTHEEPPCPNR